MKYVTSKKSNAISLNSVQGQFAKRHVPQQPEKQDLRPLQVLGMLNLTPGVKSNYSSNESELFFICFKLEIGNL